MSLSIQILESPVHLTDKTKDDFYRDIKSTVCSKADWIGVNLSGLDVIDSMGLGILIAAQKIATQHEKKLIIFSPQSHIRKELRTTGISRMIKTYGSFLEVINAATPQRFVNASRLMSFKAISLPN